MCVQYIGGCSINRWVFSTSRGYHEYIRGISLVHWGIFSTSGGILIHVGSKLIKAFDLYWKPQCTYDISLMYWTSPNVLMISPQYTEHPPMYSWYPHDVPLMYSWYPPMLWTSSNELMISPDVLNSPDVLKTHYTGWYSQTASFPFNRSSFFTSSDFHKSSIP